MKLDQDNSSDEVRQMQEEVKFLRRQVLELSNSLKEAQTYKSSFLANIRNEILDPFSSIVTLSRAMLDIRGNDIRKVKKLMSLIYQDTFALDLHLKNIFYAAEIESGELQVGSSLTEAASLITEVSSSLKPFLAKKNVRLLFSRDVSGTFHTDGEKILLVILNLTYALLQKCQPKDSLLLNIYQQEDKINVNILNLRYFAHTSTGEPLCMKDFETSLISISGLHLAVAESMTDFLNGNIKVGIRGKQEAAFRLTLPALPDEEDDVFADQSIFFG